MEKTPQYRWASSEATLMDLVLHSWPLEAHLFCVSRKKNRNYRLQNDK